MLSLLESNPESLFDNSKTSFNFGSKLEICSGSLIITSVKFTLTLDSIVLSPSNISISTLGIVVPNKLLSTYYTVYELNSTSFESSTASLKMKPSEFVSLSIFNELCPEKSKILKLSNFVNKKKVLMFL